MLVRQETKNTYKTTPSERWQSLGYTVLGYEGYQYGAGGFFTPYGGAKVWYSLSRNNGIVYSGYLTRWGDEIMVYGPDAIDAIKPSKSQ